MDEHQGIDERARLRATDRLIEEIGSKLRQHKGTVAASLSFGRITWRQNKGKVEIDFEPKL